MNVFKKVVPVFAHLFTKNMFQGKGTALMHLRLLTIGIDRHWTEVNFVGPLVPSVSDGSAHEFQSQSGSIIACALLSLALNDPQSYLWLAGPRIEIGSPGII